jgi:hypothetical protein
MSPISAPIAFISTEGSHALSGSPITQSKRFFGSRGAARVISQGRKPLESKPIRLP